MRINRIKHSAKLPATSLVETLMGMAILAIMFVFLIPIFRPHVLFQTSAFLLSPESGTYFQDCAAIPDAVAVRTAADFNNIRSNVNATYCLVNDINLASYADWVPVSGFSGKLYGNGKIVYNLKSTLNGIFSSITNSAVVQDFGLHDSKITAAAANQGFITGTAAAGSKIINVYVMDSTMAASASVDNRGGIAGSSAGEIKNVYSSANVSGKDYVGGIRGGGTSGIDNSYSSGDVSGENYVAGLVTQISGTEKITNSYATGNVTGTNDYTGGLVAHVDGGASIERAYSTGRVTGNKWVGGIAGRLQDAGVLLTYSTSTVTGTTDVGGFAGQSDTTKEIKTCYANGSVSGTQRVGGFIGNSMSKISKAYAAGAVSANDKGATLVDNVGGFVGIKNTGSANIDEVYSYGRVSVTTTNAAAKSGSFAGTADNPAAITKSAVLQQTLSPIGSHPASTVITQFPKSDFNLSKETAAFAEANTKFKSTALLKWNTTDRTWEFNHLRPILIELPEFILPNNNANNLLWQYLNEEISAAQLMSGYANSGNSTKVDQLIKDFLDVNEDDKLTNLSTGSNAHTAYSSDVRDIIESFKGSGTECDKRYDLYTKNVAEVYKLIPSHTSRQNSNTTGELKLFSVGVNPSGSNFVITNHDNITGASIENGSPNAAELAKRIVRALDANISADFRSIGLPDTTTCYNGFILKNTPRVSEAALVAQGYELPVIPTTQITNTTSLGFIINTAAALKAISNTSAILSSRFFMTDMIDLSSYATWTSIPGVFRGAFNGNYYCIANLKNAGLFSAARNPVEISNLGVRNANVTPTGSYSGVIANELGVDLAAASSQVTLRNLYATGTTVTASSYFGGLIGRTNNSIGTPEIFLIDSCYSSFTSFKANIGGGLVGSAIDVRIVDSYSTGIFTGAANAKMGGLVGVMPSGTIENSYSNASIDCTNTTAAASVAGGLAAQTGSATSTSTTKVKIINSHYDTNTVKGDKNVGGLIGSAMDTEITDSWSTGTISGKTGWVGGLVGNANNIEVNNSYSSVGKVSASGGSTANNVGGLIGNALNIKIDNSYSVVTEVAASGTNYGGVGGLVGTIDSGTVQNSYANVKSSGGADVGGLIGYINTSGATNNKIANCSYGPNIVNGATMVGGLIGRAVKTDITDSSSNATITGGQNSNIGGLIGYTQSVTIKDSRSYGTINASSYQIGGIIGTAHVVDVDNCHSETALNLTATNVGVGGFIGASGTGPNLIKNSIASGAITAASTSSYMGGFIGQADANITIENSQASGNILMNTGSTYGSYIGGFIGVAGLNFAAPTVIIKDCRASGNISRTTAEGSYIGGFVGSTGGYASVKIGDSSASGNITSTVGESTDVGGFAGVFTKGEITNSFATGTVITKGLRIGGFVGSLGNSAGEITNCYYSNKTSTTSPPVQGTKLVGGFAGSSKGAITKAYAANDIYFYGATGTYAGGFVGELQSGGTITNTYSFGQMVSSSTGTKGGFAGISAGTISNSAYNSEKNPAPMLGIASGMASASLSALANMAFPLQSSFTSMGWTTTDWTFGSVRPRLNSPAEP